MSWQPHTFAGLLARNAQEHGPREAIVADGKRITYAELWPRVRLVAANLKRLGLGRGDHFAICMGNSVEWVVLQFAAATLGAVVVPINTRFRPSEIEYCLKQADVKMLATAHRFLKIDFLEFLGEISPELLISLPAQGLPELHALIVYGDDVPQSALSSNDLYAPADQLPDEHSEGVEPDMPVLMQYTSGTTAYPKGAMLTHNNMLRNAYEVGRRIGIGPEDRYFSARPLFHVAGTTLSLLTSFEVGSCYLTIPRFDPPEILALMEEERCTMTCGNDTMFLMLMNAEGFDAEKLCLTGGWAAASESVLRAIHDRMGITRLCSAYGQSESSPNVAMSDWRDDTEKRLKGLARPLPGLEVEIRDPVSGVLCPPGKTGEIRVRGWSVMQGYYNMPERTAETIDADGGLPL